MLWLFLASSTYGGSVERASPAWFAGRRSDQFSSIPNIRYSGCTCCHVVAAAAADWRGLRGEGEDGACDADGGRCGLVAAARPDGNGRCGLVIGTDAGWCSIYQGDDVPGPLRTVMTTTRLDVEDDGAGAVDAAMFRRCYKRREEDNAIAWRRGGDGTVKGWFARMTEIEIADEWLNLDTFTFQLCRAGLRPCHLPNFNRGIEGQIAPSKF